MSLPPPSTLARCSSFLAATAVLAALAIALAVLVVPTSSRSAQNATNATPDLSSPTNQPHLPDPSHRTDPSDPSDPSDLSEPKNQPGPSDLTNPPPSLTSTVVRSNGTNRLPASDRDARRSARRTSPSPDRRAEAGRRGNRPGDSAADTNTTHSVSGTDFASFKIISDRNIFSPNRGRANGRTDREPARKPVQVDLISLVGTLSYAKGDFAFFDGSSSLYRKALKCGDSIAGFTVKTITGNAVKLEAGEKPLEMQIGSQLRREDEGEWKFVARTDAISTPTSSSSSTPAPGSGDRSATAGDSAGAANDILLKLMKKREQEK